MNPVLTIDPEFEAKCPPLTEDELSQLEETSLRKGWCSCLSSCGTIRLWTVTTATASRRHIRASGSAPMKRTSIVNTKPFPGFARTSSDGEI